MIKLRSLWLIDHSPNRGVFGLHTWNCTNRLEEGDGIKLMKLNDNRCGVLPLRRETLALLQVGVRGAGVQV